MDPRPCLCYTPLQGNCLSPLVDPEWGRGILQQAPNVSREANSKSLSDPIHYVGWSAWAVSRRSHSCHLSGVVSCHLGGVVTCLHCWGRSVGTVRWGEGGATCLQLEKVLSIFVFARSSEIGYRYLCYCLCRCYLSYPRPYTNSLLL